LRQAIRTYRAEDAITSAIVLALVALLCWIDVHWGNALDTAILYPVLLLLCLARGNRLVLWLTTALELLATIIAYFAEHGDTRSLTERVMSVFALLAATIVFDILIKSRRALEAREVEVSDRNAELEASNAELSAREEEIARQNEELQSQTEELERQGEELRTSNEELGRREKMLEALLSLSRTLASSTDRSETMDKICQTLGELINGPGTAAAIIERRGGGSGGGSGGEDHVAVVCQHGFGREGLEAERWTFKESFAALVLERGRTGYLEDIELRPDLRIPQPRTGPRMKSVLAAPLRVSGRAVGSLEVYHTSQHTWSDEQITLIESLAAQTSISLEAAELFERIEDERQRLRTVLETVPFGIAISNADCTEMRVNPAGAAMLNVPPDTPLDFQFQQSRWRNYREGKLIGIEDRPLVRACRLGEVVNNEELELVFINGRRINILTSAAPIRDRVGKIAGAVVGWADITQLKALQGELDARRREAEEASLRKSRFLAAVSHDIRTPANAISLLAELMQRTASTPALVSEIPEIAQDLKRSALTLVDLVSDVLDLTRFDSGKVDLQETIVPLNEFLTEECRQHQQAAREKGLEFQCHCDGPIVLRADRVKLSRILSNLISNAIKYTEQGQVCTRAMRLGDGGAGIAISDTGVGIPREHFAHIFDEFFQLKNDARNDRSKGSGLGLAICRRLVDAMGGRITVQSEIGKGSTFTIELPPSAVVPA
jgi:signal transduction histidine kinase